MNLNNVVSREHLLNNVWGTDYVGGSNVVDAVVTNLRKKMLSEGSWITTVRGIGYRLKIT